MGKIKVVHIITKLELGGAQENTLFTVKHLDRGSYEPVLISGTQGVLVEEARALKDVSVHLIPELVREIRPFKDVRALVKMRRILKKLQQEGTRRKCGNGAAHYCSHPQLQSGYTGEMGSTSCRY